MTEKTKKPATPERNGKLKLYKITSGIPTESYKAGYIDIDWGDLKDNGKKR